MICLDSNPSTTQNLSCPHPTTASNRLLWQAWAWDLPLDNALLKKLSTWVIASPKKLTGNTMYGDASKHAAKLNWFLVNSEAVNLPVFSAG